MRGPGANGDQVHVLQNNIFNVNRSLIAKEDYGLLCPSAGSEVSKLSHPFLFAIDRVQKFPVFAVTKKQDL